MKGKQEKNTAIPTNETRDELKAEIARLTNALRVANSNHEHFEREWYLRGDKIDAMIEAVEEYRNHYATLAWQQNGAPEMYVRRDAANEILATLGAQDAACASPPTPQETVAGSLQHKQEK